MEQPILNTERLALRPFKQADAKRVAALAGDWRVAQMTINIPQPYEPGMAENWIASLAPAFTQGDKVVYAVTLPEANELVGSVSLTDFSGEAGNLDFWVGVPYWGRGYCTEAVQAIVHYGFHQLGLSVIHAHYMRNNVASGRVLSKSGFEHKGEVMLNAHGMMRRLQQCERQRDQRSRAATE